MPIRLPIIVADGADVIFFASIEAASQYLEAVDVAAGVYRAFDTAGLPLIIRVVNNVVSIEQSPGEPLPSELARLLLAAIRGTAEERRQADALPLDALVAVARRYCNEVS